ncbi:MAG: hypothetical protein WA885_11315 [Phormidesmis sp.]
MSRLLTFLMPSLRQVWWLSAAIAVSLMAFSPAALATTRISMEAANSSAILAYDIDLEMDRARKEKTVEHYGEGIREIVEEATKNNVNTPDSKPTAQNSYERESPLNEVLPKRIGKDFSKSDLENMESDD